MTQLIILNSRSRDISLSFFCKNLSLKVFVSLNTEVDVLEKAAECKWVFGESVYWSCKCSRSVCAGLVGVHGVCVLVL
jgi:hypothetical protein